MLYYQFAKIFKTVERALLQGFISCLSLVFYFLIDERKTA